MEWRNGVGVDLCAAPFIEIQRISNYGIKGYGCGSHHTQPPTPLSSFFNQINQQRQGKINPNLKRTAKRWQRGSMWWDWEKKRQVKLIKTWIDESEKKRENWCGWDWRQNI